MCHHLISDSPSAPPANEIDHLQSIGQLVIHQDENFDLGFMRQYSVRTSQGQMLYKVSEHNVIEFCRASGSWTVCGFNSNQPFMEMQRVDSCSCCTFVGNMDIILQGVPLGRLKQTRLFPLPRFDVINAADDLIAKIYMHIGSLTNRMSEFSVSIVVIVLVQIDFHYLTRSFPIKKQMIFIASNKGSTRTRRIFSDRDYYQSIQHVRK
jgi:hypothetical protein